MRLRDRRQFTKPEVMIIPMIDIMFFLLEDKKISRGDLVRQAAEAQRRSGQFSVVIRADQGLDYGQVMALLDELKGAGVTHFGLAAESGGAK